MAKTISPPERWPSGEKKRPRRLAQIAAAERAAAEANMLTVLKQPHRRGNRSQLAESSMGRFCLTHGLDMALYDAVEAYGQLRRQWLAFAGAPLPDRLGGNDADVSLEDWKRWQELIAEWNRVMERAGGYLGRIGVVALIFDRPEPTVRIYPGKVTACLYALALHQGRIKPVDARKAVVDDTGKSVDSRE